MRTHTDAGGQMELVPPQAEDARRTLWTGLLVFRWAFFALMVFNTAGIVTEFEPAEFGGSGERDALAWGGVIVAGAWTAWLTLDRHQERRETPYVDMGIAVGLILLSSIVVPPGEVTGGRALFYAVSYPANAALLCGAAFGLAGGVTAGVVLSIALAVGRPLNGIDLLNRDELRALANGCVYYLAGGAAAGVFSTLFDRWSLEFRSLAERALRDQERATKLAERHSLARQIHDSVLHGLDDIIRRGARMLEHGSLSRDEVAMITEMAREQERALRELVTRAPEDVPAGYLSLREQLERVATRAKGVKVDISAVGRGSLPIHMVDELASAVGQALDNIVKHAAAKQATVFIDATGEDVIVSVRDNGKGFVYDEVVLEATGRAGILRSMKGRVEDLGGTMRIESEPGRGTEVEFRVPKPTPLSTGGRQ